MKIEIYQKIEKNIARYKFFFLSLLLVTTGFFVFEQRSPNATSLVYSLGIDSLNYLKLTSGQDISVKLHACRFFFPFVSSILPFDYLINIFVISFISFVFFLTYILKILKDLNHKPLTQFIVLIMFMPSFSSAYNFTNPYLTDLSGMATLTIFLYQIFKFRYFSSLFFISLSLLFRESAIIFLPLFFIVFNFKKSVLAILLISLIYIVPKIIISGSINCGFERPISFYSLIEFDFLAKTFISYGVLWFVAIKGIFFFKDKILLYGKKKFYLLSLSFLLSFGGAFLSSLKSYTDVTRMYFLLMPILIITSSYFVERIIMFKKTFVLLIVLIIFMYVTILFFLPNFLVSYDAASLKEFAFSNINYIFPLVFIQMILYFSLLWNFLKKID